MTRSEDIKELATALALAQAEIAGAKKDSENPHFRSKYADLASIWDACRGPLTKHGLAVVQSPRLVGGGENSWLVEVETHLLHKSGQWMADVLAVPVTKADAQGVGSALTYARRYSLSSIVGVAPEDDDGEGAVARGSADRQVQRKPPAGYDEWFLDLRAVAESGGLPALQDTWKQSRADYRKYLTETDSQTWEKLKAKAAKVAEVPA